MFRAFTKNLIGNFKIIKNVGKNKITDSPHLVFVVGRKLYKKREFQNSCFFTTEQPTD